PIAHWAPLFVRNFRLIARGKIFRIIGLGTDRYEHPRAVFGEDDIARPMAAPAETATGWNGGNYRLSWTARDEVAVAIGKAHDRIGIGDIDESWIRAGRPERD